MARTRIPAAQRRARILDAAVEAFAEHGFAEAKMQDIAKLAGVVPSVLYDHFGSKRELHIAVLELHAEQLRERSLRRVAGAGAFCTAIPRPTHRPRRSCRRSPTAAPRPSPT
jgi:AcrR family transcriptional regulator